MDGSKDSGGDDEEIPVIHLTGPATPPVESCTLAEYRNILARFPRPTEDQVTNFVEFVSQAHSWYKHIPHLAPGQPFVFFIDPMVGYDRRILSPDGRIEYVERTDQSQKFHYTWMKTNEYHRRFAHLSYHCAAGTAILLPGEGGVTDYESRPVFSNCETEYRIPRKIADAGTVRLTAVIHPQTAQSWVWHRIVPMYLDQCSPETPYSWPPETGGDATFQKVMALSEKREREEDYRIEDIDLQELLRPEKERLHQLMTHTINRMIDVAF